MPFHWSCWRRVFSIVCETRFQGSSFPNVNIPQDLNIYAYIICTHTHTHIYIYLCVCVCVCVYIFTSLFGQFFAKNIMHPTTRVCFLTDQLFTFQFQWLPKWNGHPFQFIGDGELASMDAGKKNFSWSTLPPFHEIHVFFIRVLHYIFIYSLGDISLHFISGSIKVLPNFLISRVKGFT